MEFLRLTTLSFPQKQQILDLWNREYPESLHHSSLSKFEDYLYNLDKKTHIVINNEDGEIEGWYVQFTRENEIWFAMIIHSKHQQKGYGTTLLNLAKKDSNLLNGWVSDKSGLKKSDGVSYHSPLPFYIKNGFDVLSDERLENDQLSAVKIRWSATS